MMVNPDVRMTVLKPEITGKHSKKTQKKQQLTENHKILNTDI